jgi:acetyl esterase/lipase
MVGTHPYYANLGAGQWVARAALGCMQALGLETAEVCVDASRLPMIHVCEKMGFEPVIPAGDPFAARRWASVAEALKRIPAKPAVRPLWPDRPAPYTEDSPGQAQPSITCYPVAGSRGAVVVCPGGGYSMKTGFEGTPPARMLNAAGISAFVLDYRVCPCHWDAPLADVTRAIRLVRSMGYEKVGVMGFSAGGHLTCSAATMYGRAALTGDAVDGFSSRPDAFVPCYPVVTFGEHTNRDTVRFLLGERAADPEMILRFSAERHVTADTPPAFIWHTADDPVVPVRNSLGLASALSACGVPFELHIFSHGVHGLGLALSSPELSPWPSMLVRWLKNLGF